jgi:hypothetical protein
MVLKRSSLKQSTQLLPMIEVIINNNHKDKMYKWKEFERGRRELAECCNGPTTFNDFDMTYDCIAGRWMNLDMNRVNLVITFST